MAVLTGNFNGGCYAHTVGDIHRELAFALGTKSEVVPLPVENLSGIRLNLANTRGRLLGHRHTELRQTLTGIIEQVAISGIVLTACNRRPTHVIRGNLIHGDNNLAEINHCLVAYIIEGDNTQRALTIRQATRNVAFFLSIGRLLTIGEELDGTNTRVAITREIDEAALDIVLIFTNVGGTLVRIDINVITLLKDALQQSRLVALSKRRRH